MNAISVKRKCFNSKYLFTVLKPVVQVGGFLLDLLFITAAIVSCRKHNLRTIYLKSMHFLLTLQKIQLKIHNY